MNKERIGNLPPGVLRAVGYTLMALPVLASFVYVREFGVNVPSTDTWTMVPLFEELYGGELGVGDLWAHHLEHRPLLPRIFMLLMGPLTNFNIVTIMYATLLYLLAKLVIVYLAYRDTIGPDSKSLFLAIPVSLLIFSFGQYWNMLNAWSIHVVVADTFAVLSYFLLTKLRNSGSRKAILLFLASILSGSAATLSAGQGLLVWPVGLLQLFLEPVLGRGKRYLMTVWSLVGVVHWAVYFWDFEVPASRLSERYFYNSPTLGVDYFLNLIGSALFENPGVAVATGLIIGVTLALVIFWMIRDRQQTQLTFWISLSAFSLLILAAVTVARGGEGLGASVLSKYVSSSVLLTTSVYVLALKLALDRGRSRFAALMVGVCAVLILLSAPLSYYSGVQYAEELRMQRERQAYILFHYKSETNNTLAEALRPSRSARGEHPIWFKRQLRRDAAVLDDLDYTVFAESASEISPTHRQGKQ